MVLIPETCKFTDAMKDAAVIPPQQISVTPNIDTAEKGKLRYTASNPGATIPVEKDSAIIVALTPDSSSTPSKVNKVIVKGNVDKVRITYISSPEDTLWKPLDANKTGPLTANVEDVVEVTILVPVNVYKLKVELLEPKTTENNTKPSSYKVTLEIHACREFTSKKSFSNFTLPNQFLLAVCIQRQMKKPGETTYQMSITIYIQIQIHVISTIMHLQTE